jgi:SAM-dependent methyltransferase
LDVGSGCGQNTRLLLDHDFEVTAIDISERALTLCRREAPEARTQWVDLREGLPFAGDYFELIVADLSLHYFPWGVTNAIVRDVADRLVPGGVFAGRFNSTGDANYGAGSAEPVRGEPNMYIVDGIKKRFFTRECFSRLLGTPWKMVALAEKTTCRFGPTKVFWELAATKSG